VKTRLATPGDDREVARAVLLHVFDQALRLLHPIVPFVTEALWQKLPGIVDAMRRVRSEYNVPPNQAIDAFVVAADSAQRTLESEGTLLMRLTKTALTAVERAPAGPAANV